jgi:hypothetical protein
VEHSGEASAVACPRHKAPDHVREVSVVFTGGAASSLSPHPVLKTADRLAWAGTGLGVAGMIAIWAGNVVQEATVGLLCAIPCFAYALALYGWAAARRARLTRVERGIPTAMAIWRSALYCERCEGVFFPPGTPWPPPPTPSPRPAPPSTGPAVGGTEPAVGGTGPAGGGTGPARGGAGPAAASTRASVGTLPGATPDAAGAPPRDLMTAADFQRLVWSAGGYGDVRHAG